ncbi:Archaeal fructose-1,6-bisphosphatase or related enzyme of inositol monophosphatase family [Marinomonas fungiae]|uniref:Archaeal fructose-1,6-bisphosphatase or related enzyme of inositol monophosphatase family n=2 Tax=Marinomonas fungiae TaxID=1137284 RepID=A0A0K6IIL7_9GAMM|nr:Archaeal fructose-1,6-bisphosphatase or related enzyme of inositol monophosphatase family [Marinomonas fungiae]
MIQYWYPMQPRINVAMKAARAAADFIIHAQEKMLFDKEAGQNAAEVYQNVCTGAERSIVHHLEKAYPADKITTRLQGTVQEGKEGEWVVDAIQGQHLFTRGLSGYAITISYLVAGKVEHALLVNPSTRDEFYASKGRGAYLNNSRIRTGAARSLENTTLATQFPGTENTIAYATGQFKVLEEVANKGARVVMQDAPATMLANVAAGRLDAAWGLDLREWEVQAPLFIAKEAGCLFAGFDGAPNYETGNVLCANPRLFKYLLPILNKQLGA